ncbi:MAG TPA: mycothiol synthase [Pedococcus sp.]
MVYEVRPVDAPFEWSVTTPSGTAAEVRAVLDRAEASDGAAALDEAALLALRHRGLAGSTLLVTGEPVAGFAWLREDDLSVVVDPAARAAGRGRALVAAAVARGLPDGLTAWSHGNHPAAAALAREFGFTRVRDLWVMRRSLDDLPPPPEPGAGGGVVVRPFRPGQDEEAFLAVNAEAFADHPEQGTMSRADLEQRMAEPWFDPAGFFVAEARPGELPGTTTDPADAPAGLVGFHWTKVHHGERPVGEVYVVGVSPRAQGGGLGALLTLTGLHHLAGQGLREVLLYVESDNAPAVAVYSRLGFTHADADTHVQYRFRG